MPDCRTSFFFAFFFLSFIFVINGAMSGETNLSRIALNSTISSPLKFFSSFAHSIIDLLAVPFPNGKVFFDSLLHGNLSDFSIKDHFNEWASYECYWVILCLVFVGICLLCTLNYAIYRCFLPLRDYDENRADEMCRPTLNVLITIFALVATVATFVLLLSGLNAANGMAELPERINVTIQNIETYSNESKKITEKISRINFGTTKNKFFEKIKKINASSNYMDLVDGWHTTLKTLEVFNSDINDINSSYREFFLNCSNSENSTKLAKPCKAAIRVLEKIDLENSTKNLTDVYEIIKELNEIVYSFKNEFSEFITNQGVKIFNLISMIDNLPNIIEQIHLNGMKNLPINISASLSTYSIVTRVLAIVFTVILDIIILVYILGVLTECLCGDDSTENSIFKSETFYNWAIWLTVVFLVIFALINSALFLFGATATNLVCDPLEKNFSTPKDLLQQIIRLNYLEKNNNSQEDPLKKMNEIFSFNEMINTEKNNISRLKLKMNQEKDMVEKSIQNIHNLILQNIENPLNDLNQSISSLTQSIEEKHEESNYQNDIVTKIKEFKDDLDTHFEKINLLEIKKIVTNFTSGSKFKNMYNLTLTIENYWQQIQNKLSNINATIFANIGNYSRVALCDNTVYHINIAWLMLMIILLMFIIILVLSERYRVRYSKREASVSENTHVATDTDSILYSVHKVSNTTY